MMPMPLKQSTATIVSLNRSNGGVPKLPVNEARVTVMGMEGDRQKHTKIHGGPDKALCLYAMELIEAFQKGGHPIVPGSIGENVTIRGLDWSTIEPGTVLELGEVEIRVTRFTTPCNQIRGAFEDGDYRRVSEDVSPGQSRVYARVLREGVVRVGDEVRVKA